ncbi:MAG: PepSY-associated TM helix domain-containing protein [Myxococcota bacterium]
MRPAGPGSWRPWWVRVHRYVGLVMAVFLLVSGSTGALLPFHRQLDAWINPELFIAPSHPRAEAPRDVLDLREGLERSIVGASFSYVELDHDAPSSTAVFFASYDPELVADADSRDDEFFVDRHNGRVLGSRKWGDITQGTVNFVPLCYRLHYTLGLGDVGRVLLGIIALLWTLDCFVGAYLTLPPRARRVRGRAEDDRPPRRSTRRWFLAWGRSWRVRTSSMFGFVFTWHRASGLWVWAMLLLVAWSSVALNLDAVYSPVMRAVFESEDVYATLPRLEQPRTEPEVSWQGARRLGRAAMQDQAAAGGFTVLEERSLGYRPHSGLYTYKVLSSLDASVSHPNTTVWIDADTGAAVAFFAPTGRAEGDTVTTWLTALHFGAISFTEGGREASLGYRLFVMLVGLLVVGLSASGLWIWWTKRARRARASTAGGD